jgi:hypothetical protein
MAASFVKRSKRTKEKDMSGRERRGVSPLGDPIDDSGVPVSGPEVEWSAETREQLEATFADLDRAQLEALHSSRDYWVKR